MSTEQQCLDEGTNQGANLVWIAELLNPGLYAHNVTAMSSAITRRDGARL